MKVIEIMEETYYEIQDKIVPDALLDSLDTVVSDVIRWRSMGDDVPEYVKKDLEYSERYAEGLAIVLDAWTTEGSDDRIKMENLISCLKNS